MTATHIARIDVWAALIVLAGCAWLTSAGCAAPDALPPPGEFQTINDTTFTRAFETNATPLCDSGAAATIETLEAQLERRGPVAGVRRPAPRWKALSPEELYERCGASVLVVSRLSKCDRCPKWHHRNAGTAFVIDASGICVTCRHMFEKEEPGVMVAVDREANVYPVIELLASSVADDLAVVRIGGSALPALPLRPRAAVGSSVFVISHPKQHYYALTAGLLSRRVQRFHGISGELDSHHNTPTELIEITADYAIGSSGAAVLDEFGNVVGVVALTTTVRAGGAKDGDPQMVLRTCASAEAVAQVLGSSR